MIAKEISVWFAYELCYVGFEINERNNNATADGCLRSRESTNEIAVFVPVKYVAGIHI